MTLFWEQTYRLQAKPYARPRFTGKRAYNDPKYTAYKLHLQSLCNFKGDPLLGPLGCILEFRRKRPKRPKANHPIGVPDLDNLAKAVMDALNDQVWKDDSQIVEMSIKKKYVEEDKNVGVFVGVYKLD